jgi:hypothetical protein
MTDPVIRPRPFLVLNFRQIPHNLYFESETAPDAGVGLPKGRRKAVLSISCHSAVPVSFVVSRINSRGSFF